MTRDSNDGKWQSAGQRWVEQDPDPVSAAALRRILDTADDDAIRACFEPPLEFGTAGIRGIVGPGPARMNVAVVRRVTSAVAEVLAQHALEETARQDSGSERSPVSQSSTASTIAPVVLGYDGRIDSARFAREAVAVLAATNFPVALFPSPMPTPVVAFAGQRMKASASIVITASHNPPEYNGYKLYGPEAIQIIPPFDVEVSTELSRLGGARDIPVVAGAFDGGHGQVSRLDASVGEAYVEAVLAGRVAGAKAEPIRIAYTPLHGVGAAWIERVFGAAGYRDLHFVTEQREIDGHFPTVSFPNPEDPAVLAMGMRLARDIGADLLLANDPDADRLAAAVRQKDGYRVLSGNEIGIILTDYLLSHAPDPSRAAVTSTIVSTPMTRRIADRHGAHFETTLTGFKWLWTAMRRLEAEANKQFAICWEEALGYSTHSAVRDKDGIAAALVLADWVSECYQLGVGPIERLGELYRTHGCWASSPRNLVRPVTTGVSEIRRMMQSLRQAPPAALCGRRVLEVTDFARGASKRPMWCGATEMLVLAIEDGARVVVRPSGTEPKLKLYADLELPIGAGQDPLELYEMAKAKAEQINEDLVRRLEMVG